MSSHTTEVQTELQAINEILTSLGQTPVTTLDETNPDVAVITETLNVVSREVQAEGWAFNLEKGYTFSLDGDSKVAIPTNVLKLDLEDGNASYFGIDSVIRQGFLYNKTEHTFVWDDALKCDVTWWFELTDLPRPIYDYIVAKAASLSAAKIIGDAGQYQLLQQREAYTRAFALEHECQVGDYSYFGSSSQGNFYNAYQPYKALAR